MLRLELLLLLDGSCDDESDIVAMRFNALWRDSDFLTYTHEFGLGDFTMTAQMKLFDLDGSAGTFRINDGQS